MAAEADHSADETTPTLTALARRRRRRFTVDEANRTLPLVRRIAADIVKTHAAAREIHTQLTRRLSRQLRQDLEADLDRIVNKLQGYVDELTDIGVELKDYQHGLVDFVARHDGRDIYLCWKLGEPDITHWHELHEGFQARQPVSALGE